VCTIKLIDITMYLNTCDRLTTCDFPYFVLQRDRFSPRAIHLIAVDDIP
jgi:hypothetical protein